MQRSGVSLTVHRGYCSFGCALPHFQSTLIYPNLEATCKWSQLSPPLPHRSLSVKSNYSLQQKTPSKRHSCSWNSTCTISHFLKTGSNTCQILSHIEEQNGRSQKPLSAEYLPHRGVADTRKGISVVLMKHPPTHYMPRGTTDCFVVGWKDAIKFHSCELFLRCQRILSLNVNCASDPELAWNCATSLRRWSPRWGAGPANIPVSASASRTEHRN